MADLAKGHRVTVFELDDLESRIRPDRPNVFVTHTRRQNVEGWAMRVVAGTEGPLELRGHVRAHLGDLAGKYLPRPTVTGADRLKRKVQDKLIRRSHRVRYRNSHRLYVLELDPEMAESTISKAWLYVGQTTKDPNERLEDHRTNRNDLGARDTCGTVLRFRPDLVQDRHPLPSIGEAEAAEGDLAHDLLARGYDVASDQLRPRRLRTHRRRE